MLTTSTATLLAAGAAVVGLVAYLDYKRTHAPDYQQKLRESE